MQPVVRLQRATASIRLPGIRILKSNVLANQYGKTATDNAAVTGENNDYAVNNSNLAGLIFHREAAGVLTSVAPTIQTTSGDFNVQYQGDLVVGKLAMAADSSAFLLLALCKLLDFLSLRLPSGPLGFPFPK